MDKLALGQVLLGILRFSPVRIIPLMLHAHSFSYYLRHASSARRSRRTWCSRHSVKLPAGTLQRI